MRGKTVVFVLLGGAIIFAGFAYWFFFSQSSPDDRFNLNRQPIPASAGDSVLFGPLPEDYKAAISQHIAPDAAPANYGKSNRPRIAGLSGEGFSERQVGKPVEIV